MKSAVPIVAILAIAAVGVGTSIGVGVFLFSQKNTITNNIRIVYNTNEAYRGIVSLLNLGDIYFDVSVSDYIKLTEEKKDFIIKKINRTLLGPECFKIIKESEAIIEYPEKCEGKMYGAVVPIFVPGGKVENLYLNYDR